MSHTVTHHQLCPVCGRSFSNMSFAPHVTFCLDLQERNKNIDSNKVNEVGNVNIKNKTKNDAVNIVKKKESKPPGVALKKNKKVKKKGSSSFDICDDSDDFEESDENAKKKRKSVPIPNNNSNNSSHANRARNGKENDSRFAANNNVSNNGFGNYTTDIGKVGKVHSDMNRNKDEQQMEVNRISYHNSHHIQNHKNIQNNHQYNQNCQSKSTANHGGNQNINQHQVNDHPSKSGNFNQRTSDFDPEKNAEETAAENFASVS